MTLIGLSLLVASVSFLCYKHPPSPWSFLDWIRRTAVQDVGKKVVAPGAIEGNTKSYDDTRRQTDEKKDIKSHDGKKEIQSTTEQIKDNKPTTKELDRKAMPPPPPPPPKKPDPQSPTTPKASSIPSFTLSSSSSDSPPPSFPSLNSAQRATGGRTGPPRLNPLPTAPQPPLRTISSSSTNHSALMPPPPPRGPLPNRSSPSTTTLFPPPTATTPTPRSKKVLLSPGHSPLDWARLTTSPTANLRGLPPSTPYLRVPPSLLKHHNGRKDKATGKKKDVWTVLGGKVYNITPYLPFHPGGEGKLLRAAGKDGTKLFGEVHPWVNWEGMLEPGCLVGVVVEEGESGDKEGGRWEEMD